MVILSRHLNVLRKYGTKSLRPFPFKIKIQETSCSKAHVCAFHIVSSNHHQYSTLQNGRTSKTIHLFNHRLPVASIVSYYHLPAGGDMNRVQGVQSEIQSPTNFVAPGVTDGSAPEPVLGETVASSATTSTSDLAESFVSGGNFSDSLSVASTDALSVVDNVELPLSALGLAGYTPVGFVQSFIELLHVNLNLPWWSSIVLATFIARLVLFPVLVKAQQNAALLSNYMPQLQFLQTKFNKARRCGNPVEASKCAMEIQMFMQEHKINPLKSSLIPLMQAPVFISFFLGLRSMASLPVESFKTGGLLWITDLTVPDPYYITPIVTCATLYVVIKVGAESGVKLENMKLARYVLTALPIVILPFTINFPAAVLCYWCANNFFTLGAVSLLRMEKVRVALNIPKKKPIDPQYVAKKGFIQGVKEAYEDQKVLGIMADRARVDEVRFKKAGTGPIPRTYSYDPTKERPAAAAAARMAQAKEYKP